MLFSAYFELVVMIYISWHNFCYFTVYCLFHFILNLLYIFHGNNYTVYCFYLNLFLIVQYIALIMEFIVCRQGCVIPDVLTNPVVCYIAKMNQKTPAQILLRYFMQQGIVVIPKSVTPNRIAENCQVRYKYIFLSIFYINFTKT